MNVKAILLEVAEKLPPGATVLDAINELEFFMTAAAVPAGSSAHEHISPDSPETCTPAWLYESSSRMLTVLQQSHGTRGYRSRFDV